MGSLNQLTRGESLERTNKKGRKRGAYGLLVRNRNVTQYKGVFRLPENTGGGRI